MPHLPREPIAPFGVPDNREIAPEAWTLPVTPAGAHFVRSHFSLPHPSGEVTLGGAIGEPSRFTLEELRSMELRTRQVTLECAGNGRAGMAPLPPGEPWRRGAVSTAVWTGVPLASLLRGVRDDAVEILVRGADRGVSGGDEIAYERAIPVGTEALLALEMNGAPIPPEHGGPIRLIVPDWYGMASVKWVVAIEALTQPFQGFFQTRDYVYDDGPVTLMRPSSHIVAPVDEMQLLRGAIIVWGWAWSGSPIAGVEISLDAGPWRETAVADAGSWVRWEARLDLAPGRHSLRARARDRDGQVQPEEPVRNRLGYGNNAVETVVFTVR
jgi:DMSO/TMAO reductase YedYZ molybdopterin-dependent catalytic subunit